MLTKRIQHNHIFEYFYQIFFSTLWWKTGNTNLVPSGEMSGEELSEHKMPPLAAAIKGVTFYQFEISNSRHVAVSFYPTYRKVTKLGRKRLFNQPFYPAIIYSRVLLHVGEINIE